MAALRPSFNPRLIGRPAPRQERRPDIKTAVRLNS
ncbi:hypothetical protein NCHU2750_16230 [Neorhizobium sp. NCHU2750]|nr:hypothetical protein NCHU2750_16230 [Neorhizobium sp. NCHU2750]